HPGEVADGDDVVEGVEHLALDHDQLATGPHHPGVGAHEVTLRSPQVPEVQIGGHQGVLARDEGAAPGGGARGGDVDQGGDGAAVEVPRAAEGLGPHRHGHHDVAHLTHH